MTPPDTPTICMMSVYTYNTKNSRSKFVFREKSTRIADLENSSYKQNSVYLPSEVLKPKNT